MSQPQQPDLATIIQQAKANFYATNGQANSVFENVINMLVREIQQREKIIQDLQGIVEDKKGTKKKAHPLIKEIEMTEKELADNIKANN